MTLSGRALALASLLLCSCGPKADPGLTILVAPARERGARLHLHTPSRPCSTSGSPAALKIFLWSLVAGVSGGYVTLHLGTWLVERFFAGNPMAIVAVVLATGAVGVASAVTAGVLLGKHRLPGS